MEQFSDETLQHILGYLLVDLDSGAQSVSQSLYSLSSASKTCRTLQKNACPLLYKNINLSCVPGDARKLFRTLASNPPLRRFVFNVNVDLSPPTPLILNPIHSSQQAWSLFQQTDHIYQYFKGVLLSTDLSHDSLDTLLVRVKPLSDQDQQCALLLLLCTRIVRMNIQTGGFDMTLSQSLTGHILSQFVRQPRSLGRPNRPLQHLMYVELTQTGREDITGPTLLFRVPTLVSATYINASPFPRELTSRKLELPPDLERNSSLRKLHVELLDVRFTHLRFWDVFPRLQDLTFVKSGAYDRHDHLIDTRINYEELGVFLAGGNGVLQAFRLVKRQHTHNAYPGHRRISPLSDLQSIQELALPFSSLIGNLLGRHTMRHFSRQSLLHTLRSCSAASLAALKRSISILGQTAPSAETFYAWECHVFHETVLAQLSLNLQAEDSYLISFPPLVDLLPTSLRYFTITCADSFPAVESRLDDDLRQLMLDKRFFNLVSIDLQRDSPPDQNKIPKSWELSSDTTFSYLRRKPAPLVLQTEVEEKQLE